MVGLSVGQYLAPAWTAFAVSSVVAYPCLRALVSMKSRQTISPYAPKEHMAKQGTPTMGGLIIVAGIICALMVITDASCRYSALALVLGFALIGFADDYVVPTRVKGSRGIAWKEKLAMQVAFAAFAAYLLRVPLVSAMWLVFAVLFCANAYNFVDGLDGLAGSVGVILACGFASLSFLRVEQVWLVQTMASVALATVPFLYLNAPPARVFMGDVGSLPIGALFGLAAWSLIANPTGDLPVGETTWLLPSVLILCALLIAELVPVPLQILSVKLRKKKLFRMTPIHHGFEDAGWPESRVVWAFALSQLVFAALAISYAIWRMESMA